MQPRLLLLVKVVDLIDRIEAMTDRERRRKVADPLARVYDKVRDEAEAWAASVPQVDKMSLPERMNHIRVTFADLLARLEVIESLLKFEGLRPVNDQRGPAE